MYSISGRPESPLAYPALFANEQADGCVCKQIAQSYRHTRSPFRANKHRKCYKKFQKIFALGWIIRSEFELKLKPFRVDLCLNLVPSGGHIGLPIMHHGHPLHHGRSIQPHVSTQPHVSVCCKDPNE